MSDQPAGTRPSTTVEGVTQTIIYSPELNAIGVYGNCMQAAVATLLELPLDAVPHFAAFEDWEAALRLFLQGLGYGLRMTPSTEWPGHRALVTGPSPRGVGHIVVGEAGALLWDPHPSRDGITSVTGIWSISPFDDYPVDKGSSGE